MTPLKSVDEIFDDLHLRNHSDYYLQAMLYARIVRRSTSTPTAPALLFIQHAATQDYNPVLKFGNDYIDDMATDDGDRFARMLKGTIEEIFNPATPFFPTVDTKRCTTCPYVQLCGL